MKNSHKHKTYYKKKEGTETMNNNKFPPVLSIMAFLAFCLVLFNSLVSLILYHSSVILGIELFSNWWVCWWFSFVILSSIPFALVIDGMFGIIYEGWGRVNTKQIFVFTSKVLEALYFVFIVYQADQWLKGVTCSMWSIIIIGFSYFLLVEWMFETGKRIGRRMKLIRSMRVMKEQKEECRK